MVLLVVDTQKGCFNENLYSFETVKKNIKELIAAARENNVEVIYVQHDDGPGKDLDKETAYKYFNEFMWPRRYAKTVSVEEAIEMMKRGIDNGIS